MHKICAILIGMPASGKSTFRTELLGLVASKQQQVSRIWTTISTDDIVENYAKSRGETYAEAWPKFIGQAEKTAFAQLKYAATSSDDVIIVDRTHMNKASRAKVMNMAKESNSEYKFIAFTFHCEPVEHERRLNSRPGKEIPAEALEGMRKRYEAPSLDEGFEYISHINTTRGGLDINSCYNIFLNIMEGKLPHNYRK